MSDRTEFLDPDFEPGEFDRIERELRRSLSQEAGRVRPADRLDTILHEAHAAGPVTATGGTGVRRWFVPAAAAAVVAAIAGGVWLSNQDPSAPPGPPAGSPSVTVPSPSATASAPSATDQPTTPPTSGSGASTTRTDGPGAPVALPAYFVGPIGDDKPTYKLFREFVRGELPSDASAAEKAKAALVLAINAQPYSNTDGFLQPWSGQTIGNVTVKDGLITIDLANAGNPDAAVTTEIQRLAVQGLVWTAQAAIQQALPVRFEVAGASGKLFGSISTDQTFTRPGKDELWKDVAPIWITSPSRDQVFPAGEPVVVKGLAIVFEATVNWQLDRGTTQVTSGHATATIGAPMQGEYAFKLGTLPAGDYTISVRELSPKDGSVSAEKSVSFSVK